MDRREALKKIALGSATVGAASIVVSTPAFAAFTVIPVAPTATTTVSPDERDATFFLGQANPACGGSTTAPGATRSSTFSITTSRVTASPTTGSVALVPTAAATANISNPAKWAAGDTATVSIRTEFRCAYVGGTGVLCRVYTFNFVYSASLKNFVAAAPVPTSC